MPAEHIVKTFDEDLKRLSYTIARMGGLVESQLEAAIQAVVRRDSALAVQVVEGDGRIDELEHEVDTVTVRLLALRQPVANDLRSIIGALKIAADLERIGDYAANVAKRAIILSQVPPITPLKAVPRIGALVRQVLREVIDSYIEQAADRAVAAWRRDEEIDEMYNSLFRELLTYMMEDPRSITAATHLLFIAKNIERIGDHATNIAETVYYTVRGTPLRQSRPKGDTSSYALVTHPDAGAAAPTEEED